MLTAKECTAAIETAIKKFGTHNYYDKGPQEVLDVDALQEKTKDMDGHQIAEVFVDVRLHEHGEHLVRTLMCCLDGRKDLDDLYADERVSDLY